MRRHQDPQYHLASAGLIHVLLDPLLIFVPGPIPGMGISGAAWATVVAWGAGYSLLRYLLAKRELVNRAFPGKTVLISSGREMLRIGVPAAGANMMTPLAAGVMTSIAAGFGNNAVAAFGVGARMEATFPLD